MIEFARPLSTGLGLGAIAGVDPTRARRRGDRLCRRLSGGGEVTHQRSLRGLNWLSAAAAACDSVLTARLLAANHVLCSSPDIVGNSLHRRESGESAAGCIDPPPNVDRACFAG